MTLIEMLIVVALIGLLIGIMFPAVSSGLDSLRLNESANVVVSFFNEGLNRTARREQAVEITIDPAQKLLSMRSPGPGFEKKFALPMGISIVKVLPERDEPADEPRRFMLYPGGAVPRFGVEIANGRNVHRIIRVDPITGVPQIETGEREAQ